METGRVYRSLPLLIIVVNGCVVQQAQAAIVKELCKDNLIIINSSSTTVTVHSPNYPADYTSDIFDISEECEMSLIVSSSVVRPFAVLTEQTSPNACTVPYAVLTPDYETPTGQSIHCDQQFVSKNHSIYTPVAPEDNIIVLQLPKGSGAAFLVHVSVIPARTTFSNPAVNTATPTMTSLTTSPTTAVKTTTLSMTSSTTSPTKAVNTATPTMTSSTTVNTVTVLTAMTTPDSDVTPTKALSTISSVAAEGRNTTTVGSFNETATEPTTRDFFTNTQSQIAVGAGAGGFVLIIIIVVLACHLVRVRQRKACSRDSNEMTISSSEVPLSNADLDSTITSNSGGNLIVNPRIAKQQGYSAPGYTDVDLCDGGAPAEIVNPSTSNYSEVVTNPTTSPDLVEQRKPPVQQPYATVNKPKSGRNLVNTPIENSWTTADTEVENDLYESGPEIPAYKYTPYELASF